MTDSILMQTLKKHGLERFDPSVEGEKFDPNLHDAQFMTKMEDKVDGTVFSTIQKGYILNGRVVRVRLLSDQSTCPGFTPFSHSTRYLESEANET